jgi:four helix bundle protein
VEATGVRGTGHRGLLAWQQAFELAASCHELADELPWRTQRALADQIRRAGVSVAANIAEGCGRRSRGDFLRMLRIAHGSLAELETHLLLVERRAYIPSTKVERRLAQLTKVGQLLGGLMRALERGARKAKPASDA